MLSNQVRERSSKEPENAPTVRWRAQERGLPPKLGEGGLKEQEISFWLLSPLRGRGRNSSRHPITHLSASQKSPHLTSIPLRGRLWGPRQAPQKALEKERRRQCPPEARSTRPARGNRTVKPPLPFQVFHLAGHSLGNTNSSSPLNKRVRITQPGYLSAHTPGTEDRRQRLIQKFFSHRSGGWMFKIKVSEVTSSLRSRLACCAQAFPGAPVCVHTSSSPKDTS